MGKQYIDFTAAVVTSTTDTGDLDSASIRPFVNGESADQSVLNRPHENVRLRTEAIRKKLDDLLYINDADRALLVTGGGNIAWGGVVAAGGTGVFTITSNLVLRPFLSASTPIAAQASIKNTDNVLIPLVNAGQYELVCRAVAAQYVDPTSLATINPARAYSGANKITVRMVGTSGGTLGCTVTGNPADNVTITFNSAAGGTTLQDVVTFLGTSSNAGAVDFRALGIEMVLGSSAIGSNKVTVKDGTEDKTFALSGGLDAELHQLTAAGLAAFFSDPLNKLQSGDTLVIYYDQVNTGSTTTPSGRRQSTGALPENNSSVDANLALLRRLPDTVANAIPLATVNSGDLHFINGRRLVMGGVTSFNSDGTALPQEWADGTTGKKIQLAKVGGDQTVNGQKYTLRSGASSTIIDPNGATAGAQLDLGHTGSITTEDTGKIQVGGGNAGSPVRAKLDATTGAGGQGKLTLSKDAEADVVMTKDSLDSLIAGIAVPPTPSDVDFTTGLVGSSPIFARADHTHAVVNTGGTPQPVASASGAAGVASGVAREDHVHPHGDLIGDTLHAPAVTNTNGFMGRQEYNELKNVAVIGYNEALGITDGAINSVPVIAGQTDVPFWRGLTNGIPAAGWRVNLTSPITGLTADIKAGNLNTGTFGTQRVHFVFVASTTAQAKFKYKLVAGANVLNVYTTQGDASVVAVDTARGKNAALTGTTNGTFVTQPLSPGLWTVTFEYSRTANPGPTETCQVGGVQVVPFMQPGMSEFDDFHTSQTVLISGSQYWLNSKWKADVGGTLSAEETAAHAEYGTLKMAAGTGLNSYTLLTQAGYGLSRNDRLVAEARVLAQGGNEFFFGFDRLDATQYRFGIATSWASAYGNLNWHVFSQGSTPVLVDTGIDPIAATVPQTLRIELDEVSARFYINGQLVHEDADLTGASFPTLTNRLRVGLGVGRGLITGDEGTSAINGYVDYLGISWKNRRNFFGLT
jgi:hypothetical protein